MADLSILSDDEQIDALKKWWKSNGISIVAGLALGVGAIAGWQAWLDNKKSTEVKASIGYESALIADKSDPEKGKKDIDKFLSTNKSNVYADNLALYGAKKSAENKEYPEAVKYLTWVLDNSKSKLHQLMARINLAKVQLANNEAAKAIATINQITDYLSFTAEAKLILGDALLKNGDIDGAKLAYQIALDRFANNKQLADIVQLKLNNL